MNIPFSCPHCGHFTQVEIRYAGQSGKCTACDKNITIPTPEQAARTSAASPANAADGDDRDHTASRPAPTIAKKKNAVLWLVGYAALAILTGAAVLWLMLSTIFAPPPNNVVPGSGSCQANLQQIGQAMESYYQEHGHFPCSKNQSLPDQPPHSWRVALLPHLGDQRLFKSVKTQKNWQGSNDPQFQQARPPVYAAADDENLSDLETSYFAIVSEQSGIAAESPNGRRKEEFTDGLAQSILLIEARDLAVRWIEMEDLDAETIDWGINAKKNGIGSHHKAGGVHVLMASGDVYWLDESTPPEVLLALTTIDGGETVDIKRWLKR